MIDYKVQAIACGDSHLGCTLIPNTWYKVMKIPSQAPFDGLMGSNFYRNNLVYFDFGSHKIHVKKL